MEGRSEDCDVGFADRLGLVVVPPPKDGMLDTDGILLTMELGTADIEGRMLCFFVGSNEADGETEVIPVRFIDTLGSTLGTVDGRLDMDGKSLFIILGPRDSVGSMDG